MIATAIGLACYGLLLKMLWIMVTSVVEFKPLPLEKLKETIRMLYFTVRYEDDNAGTWQVIEDRDGNRYRVLIRNEKGEMKW